MIWFFYLWALGFVSNILGVIIRAEDFNRVVIQNKQYPAVLIGFLVLFMSALWPGFAVLSLVRIYKDYKHYVPPEKAERIKHSAAVARERFVAEQTLEKAKEEGAQIVKIKPGEKIVIGKDSGDGNSEK